MYQIKRELTNSEFIDKFGMREFREMCRFAKQELMVARATRKMKKLKVHSKKNTVTFFKENGAEETLDLATVFIRYFN